MADFHQEGIITTLHGLYEAFDREEYLDILERKLEEYARHVHISLLLPSLYSEIQNPVALDQILEEIGKVNYLHRVVVALGGAQEESKFRKAKKYFSRLRKPDLDVKVVWVEGSRIQKVLQEIQERDISTGVQGKGQSVWVALGYLFAKEDCHVIALHDCDILTYDRILLGRLIEPTANPNNDFEFCKGYYPRISPEERTMKGRVTRIFVTPFVDTMSRIMRERGMNELRRFFSYHRTFNYPLAGEISFVTRLARGISIAYDWGLEVSTLSEVYKRVIPPKIAQIDLAPNYDHKHQELSQEDAGKGLHRMVVDIAKFFLNYVRSHGFPLDDATVDMILHSYYENTLGFIKSYSDDAEVNGLYYDRYQEELTAQYFRGFLWTAWEQIKGPHQSTLIPPWNRVAYSVPNIYNMLLEAVETDNA
ncbi:MAG: glycosyl transferase [Deltaproteobacteria bacterium]|nr:glycosyl transferase [Deltaproteobacteria bacterium]MBW2015739.1 glycosyl transferase [Deltaproteobacteria bacterium]MBW2128678.1 glycosyl transferase [Deltaproteobacteria bacterium]MBW2302743.1 glycosyl transferase [Deltaproteobacteria bacterium]